MRKNKFFMLGIITVFVAILSLTFVSSTFARYTSTVSGSDSARVAKWAFKFNGADIDLKVEKTVEFDLFNTILDDEGGAETNTNANLIAPGTSGSFQFTVTSAAEVTSSFNVVFASNEVASPIVYSIDDGANWVEDLEDLNFNVASLAAGATETYNIQWKWSFVGDDTTDTNLGIDSQSHTAQITITFDQVD